MTRIAFVVVVVVAVFDGVAEATVVGGISLAGVVGVVPSEFVVDGAGAFAIEPMIEFVASSFGPTPTAAAGTRPIIGGWGRGGVGGMGWIPSHGWVNQ